MTGIQIFRNEQFGEVRTIAKDGEPWFVAKSVRITQTIKVTGKGQAYFVNKFIGG